MIIKRVKLENIRSYENQEIVFPLGSTVLSGDIGSGKTSVLLAIEFALFGLQPGQKGNSLLKNGKDEGSVLLEIEIDGKNIIIERGLKRGKSVNQSSARITLEDCREEISITELKNRVLALLNYPKEFVKKTNLLYKFTVYTPQEEMKQIILEQPETRLDTLRHIFGIDKYKRIKENTETLTSRLREKIKNYEGQISNLEELKKKLEERNNSIKTIDKSNLILLEELAKIIAEREQAENDKKKVEDKIKEKEKYEQEIEKTRIMLLGKKEMIQNLENEFKLSLKQIEEARKIPYSQEDLYRLENEVKNGEELIEGKNKNYMEILSKINSINSRIAEIEKSKSQISFLDLCPTCFQKVSSDYRVNVIRKFEDDLTRHKAGISELLDSKKSISKELENLKQLTDNSKKQLEELKIIKVRLESIKEKEAKLLDLENKKNFLLKDINLLENQIETLKESVFLLKKYDVLYYTRELSLNELKKKEKEKEIELASMKKEKEMTLLIINELSGEIKDKEKIKIQLIELSEFEDWLSSNFSSVISFTERNIMLKLREEFSKLFNEWFNVLVPEIFSVHLDEDFTPIIEQQEYQLDYSFMSGGERTAVALAYRMALNQIINSFLSRIKTRDLVILDEPTDGFSEQQLDKMRDVLHQLKVKQLIIVSHETKIESFVENVIKFRKEAGISRIDAG